MDKHEIFTRVQTTLSNTLKVPIEQIQPSVSLIKDLDADSLFLAQLGIALEDEFDIFVDDAVIPELTKVQDIVDFIARELEKQ